MSAVMQLVGWQEAHPACKQPAAAVPNHFSLDTQPNLD